MLDNNICISDIVIQPLFRSTTSVSHSVLFGPWIIAENTFYIQKNLIVQEVDCSQLLLICQTVSNKGGFSLESSRKSSQHPHIWCPCDVLGHWILIRPMKDSGARKWNMQIDEACGPKSFHQKNKKRENHRLVLRNKVKKTICGIIDY